ncbi:hypothetical protein PINS_up021995 [Pythium insidiosum]|nr:hypothetical protein PINS_up021995 [Pythium insidiosum]
MAGDSTLMALERRLAEVQAAEEAATVAREAPVRVTELKPRYGFNNSYSDVFRAWHGEVTEIVSVPDPDETPASARRALRELAEDAHFDVERYLLDYAHATEDCYFDMAMEFVPFWRTFPVVSAEPATTTKPRGGAPLIVEVSETAPSVDAVTSQLSGIALEPSSVLSEADQELLRRLPNKGVPAAQQQPRDARGPWGPRRHPHWLRLRAPDDAGRQRHRVHVDHQAS